MLRQFGSDSKAAGKILKLVELGTNRVDVLRKKCRNGFRNG